MIFSKFDRMQGFEQWSSDHKDYASANYTMDLIRCKVSAHLSLCILVDNILVLVVLVQGLQVDRFQEISCKQNLYSVHNYRYTNTCYLKGLNCGTDENCDYQNNLDV